MSVPVGGNLSTGSGANVAGSENYTPAAAAPTSVSSPMHPSPQHSPAHQMQQQVQATGYAAAAAAPQPFPIHPSPAHSLGQPMMYGVGVGMPPQYLQSSPPLPSISPMPAYQEGTPVMIDMSLDPSGVYAPASAYVYEEPYFYQGPDGHVPLMQQPHLNYPVPVYDVGMGVQASHFAAPSGLAGAPSGGGYISPPLGGQPMHVPLAVPMPMPPHQPQPRGPQQPLPLFGNQTVDTGPGSYHRQVSPHPSEDVSPVALHPSPPPHHPHAPGPRGHDPRVSRIPPHFNAFASAPVAPPEQKRKPRAFLQQDFN